jgi:hypothetical protein
MNKPDKNFRLSKTAKKIIATILDPHQRGAYKRLMIDAELESKKAPPKQEKGSKRDNPTE